MKKARFSFYIIVIIFYLIPFISMSSKGIMGLVFIVVSSVKLSFKDGVITATLLIILQAINFNLKINVDYTHVQTTMILGSCQYYLIAFYIGKTTDKLKHKGNEMSNEIEKRKKIEGELKEKLTLLQSLMDTIPSPIFFKDLNHKYIGCNPAFETAIGITNSNLIGKTVYDISDAELSSEYNKMDDELINNTGKQAYESIVKYNDGSFRNIIFNKAIFKNEFKEPIGIVGIMTDITDKKESDKLKERIVEKKRIIDEILENDKIKTEFFSNISHELRTPLNVILGTIQLMELYINNNEYNHRRDKVVRNTSIMKQNCFRLLRLVNNLIDITRIDAKAFEVHLKNSDIVSIVEEITLSVSDYIENKGIGLVFDTDIEEKVIACDDEKIERIMLNLLSNSIKFTPMGGSITVNIYDKTDSICIKVEDNGEGIPQDKQSRIFQRFCQINEMFTRHHEGSGIGLSLVKSLVEMQGGNISFKSEERKGTCFIIELPVRKVDEVTIHQNSLAKEEHVERISVEFSDIYTLQ